MKNKKEFFLFLILIIFFSIAIVPKNFQNDTFFTIACGWETLENGISEIDNLTWHENLKFTNARWIFDIIIATLYNNFGFLGIYILVIIMSVLIGCIFYYCLVRRNINSFVSFISTITLMFFAKNIFAARSQIISILLFIIEIYSIEKLLETNKLKYKITLIVIPLIIANVHASIFPVYFIFYLPYIAEAILNKISFIKKDGEKLIIAERNNIKNMIIIMLIGVICGLCTPLGNTPYTSIFLEFGGISSKMIEELQPLVVINEIPFFIVNIIFLAILIFSKIKINIADFFLFLGLDILALFTYRTVYYFFFIGCISLIKILNNFLLEYNVYEIFYKAKIKKLIFIFVSVFIILTSITNFTGKMSDSYVDYSKYPVDACNYILSNLNLENVKIYNEFNYGSYMEFRKIKSFIDSRSGMFCEEFNEGVTILNDYFDTTYGLEHYDKLFDKYGVTHALLEDGSLTDIYIQNDENWKIIYSDASFVLYEKINL